MSKVATKNVQTSAKISPDLNIWYIVGFFAITTIVFFWNNLFGGMFFWEDFVEYVYPTQTLAAREFSRGIIPFWNNYTYSGMPFLADLQVGFFYPFNRLLSLFVDSEGMLSVWWLQAIIILHFFIAQINAYFLARRLNISQIGSIITAISYSFSFMMVLHVIHPMIIEHLAWFPLVLMLFIRGIEENRLRWAKYSGLVFGMSMLSGHPQMTLFLYLFLGFLSLWHLGFVLKNKTFTGKLLMKNIVVMIIPFAISAGIFMIQYMPSKELSEISQRAAITYQTSTEGSLEVKQVLTSVVPKVFGYTDGSKDSQTPFYLTNNNSKPFPYYFYWETGFYFGLVALILGIFGGMVSYKSKYGAFLIFVSVFGFLYAIGSNGFIHQIFFNLPLFGQFRIPSRMMIFAIIGFSLLSGFGIDFIKENLKNKAVFKQIIIASAIPLFFALLISIGFLNSALDTPDHLASSIQGFGAIGLLMILAVFAVLYFMNKGILNFRFAGYILIIIVMIDLMLAGGGFNQSESNPADEYQISEEVKASFKPKNINSLFRVNTRTYNPPFMAMKRNQGMINEIHLIEGYNPLVLQRVNPAVKDVDKILDLQNAKYRININTETGQAGFVESPNYFPRAWVVYKSNVFKENEVYSKMQSTEFDYKNEVVLEKRPSLQLPENIDENRKSKVNCIEFSTNSSKYKVTSDENAILCFSEIYYPSWNIYVNGKKANLLRANYSLRAVAIPKGESIVEMKFESSAFATGMWISLITLIVSFLDLLYLNLAKRTRVTN